MSVDHLYFAWWVEEDGWLWVRHDCNGVMDDWHPPEPTWQVVGDRPAPSFNCDNCGRHTILAEADRIDPPHSQEA